MKITIKSFENKVTLTDDQLDNDNYIDLVIDDKEHTLIIDDLYLAVKTFYDKKALYKTKP